ncbi:MAG: cadherin-like domain-containing protein, partial [Pseudomonadota bacterium]
NTTPVISGTLSLGETCEDGSLIITEAALLTGVTDSNGDTLNVIGLTASSGTVTDNGDGTWSYAPTPQFNGTVTFGYTVTDGFSSVVGIANLNITPINDAPQIQEEASLGSMIAGASRIITATQLLATAFDIDGDPLTAINLVAASGTVVANPDGTWTYTPEPDFQGDAVFSYQVSDGSTATPATARLDVGIARNDIIGGAGNNSLSGTSGADYIAGMGGVDTLRGKEGSDILVGGAGADVLYGGTGDDVFRFGLGDGQDSIILEDAAGFDTLAFGEGIAVADLTLSKEIYDLVIKVGAGGDQVNLINWFYGSSVGRQLGFAFADGTALSWEELGALKTMHFQGGDANDVIRGSELADIIEGGVGDDSLLGDNTSALLLGGGGNYVVSELIGAGAKINRNIYFSSDRNEQIFHNHL